MTKPPKIFFLMNKAHAAISRAAERKTQELANLSMPQHGVLVLLARQDGQTVSELAKALSIGKSSLSGLIDRMVERGFVRREKDTGDGRVVRIYREPAAEMLVQRTVPFVQHVNGLLLQSFSAEEQEVIGRFLTHLAENAEQVIDQADFSTESV